MSQDDISKPTSSSSSSASSPSPSAPVSSRAALSTKESQLIGSILREEHEEDYKHASTLDMGHLTRSTSAPPQLTIMDESQKLAALAVAQAASGEAIGPEDPRLTPEYYAYYYSQRPLDPRLPRPLFNWSSFKYARPNAPLNGPALAAAAVAAAAAAQSRGHNGVETISEVASNPTSDGIDTADFTPSTFDFDTLQKLQQLNLNQSTESAETGDTSGDNASGRIISPQGMQPIRPGSAQSGFTRGKTPPISASNRNVMASQQQDGSQFSFQNGPSAFRPGSSGSAIGPMPSPSSGVSPMMAVMGYGGSNRGKSDNSGVGNLSASQSPINQAGSTLPRSNSLGLALGSEQYGGDVGLSGMGLGVSLNNLNANGSNNGSSSPSNLNLSGQQQSVGNNPWMLEGQLENVEGAAQQQQQQQLQQWAEMNGVDLANMNMLSLINQMGQMGMNVSGMNLQQMQNAMAMMSMGQMGMNPMLNPMAIGQMQQLMGQMGQMGMNPISMPNMGMAQMGQMGQMGLGMGNMMGLNMMGMPAIGNAGGITMPPQFSRPGMGGGAGRANNSRQMRRNQGNQFMNRGGMAMGSRWTGASPSNPMFDSDPSAGDFDNGGAGGFSALGSASLGRSSTSSPTNNMYGGGGGGSGGLGMSGLGLGGSTSLRGSKLRPGVNPLLGMGMGMDSMIGGGLRKSGGDELGMGGFGMGDSDRDRPFTRSPRNNRRNAWLDEFRLNKGNSNMTLQHVVDRGLVVELATDQYGSRFIQQKLESASPEEKQAAFQQLLPETLTLCTDVFGNYVVQKFFEFGTPEQKRLLIQKLLGNILPLSLQMYGCRVVQKSIDVADVQQQALIVRELVGHVMQCVKDQNGNHVIQKCIEKVPSGLIQFIVEAFVNQIYHLSTHPYGCRVIQRLLEHCSEEQRNSILSEILDNTHELCKNQYGNYVIQHVLIHGTPWHKGAVMQSLRGTLLALSKHKFASNVIEKCFAHANRQDRAALLEEVLGKDDDSNSPLIAMVKDQFANYVIQTMIDVVDDEQREMVVNRIRRHVPNLRKIPYGKHIISRIERLTGKPILP